MSFYLFRKSCHELWGLWLYFQLSHGKWRQESFEKSLASVPRDSENKIEIHRSAGELRIKIVKGEKTKCNSYFNRYFKTSSIIVVPSDEDIIMNTLRSVCFDSIKVGVSFLKTMILLSIWSFLSWSCESSTKRKTWCGTNEQNHFIYCISRTEECDVYLWEGLQRFQHTSMFKKPIPYGQVFSYPL